MGWKDSELPEWEFERERGYPLEYVLTGADREYILTGIKKDHPEDTPEERIRARKNSLPARIQDLLTDIALLYMSDRLTPQDWKRIKKTTANLDHRVDTLVNIPHSKSFHCGSFHFGHQLGIITRMLQSTSKDGSDWKDIVWGFLLAFIGEERSQIPREKEKFESFVSECRSRLERRDNSILTEKELMNASEERLNSINRFEEPIKECGLKPTPGIIYYLQKGASFESHSERVKYVKAQIRFTPIREINQLDKHLRRDLDNIANKLVSGVEVEGVFRTFVEETGSPTSYTCPSQGLDKESVYRSLEQSIEQKSSTQAIKALAKKYDYGWPAYPIVQKRKGEWRFTKYGSLLAYCKRDKHSSTTWMYQPWEPEGDSSGWKQYIIPALNEVFNGDYDTQWLE